MPRYMRKYNQPKGLAQMEVLIEDNLDSSRYFEVSDFPSQFTSGKNLFKLQGNQSLLEPGRDVIIEVIDRNGNNIYHEVLDYIETDTQQRVVAVYIYPDTPGGFCTVTIVGTAQARPNGSRLPVNLKQQPNVRWSKRVVVRPTRENDTEIILLQSPRVSIIEKNKTYLVPVDGVADLYYELSGSNMRYERQSGQSSFDRNGNPIPAGPTFNYVITDAPFFSSSMAGGQLFFPSVSPDLAGNQVLLNPITQQPVNSVSYETLIDAVISDTKARVSTPFAPVVQTTTFSRFGEGLGAVNVQSIQLESFPNSSFTCSFTDYAVPFETASTNTVSFAKVAISNIEPETGQIRKIRTSVRSMGFTTFMPMSEQDLTAQELFTADDDLGLQLNLGSFTQQTIIDRYWRLDKDEYRGSKIYHGARSYYVDGDSNDTHLTSFASGSARSSTTYGMDLNNSVLINGMKLQHPTSLGSSLGTLSESDELHTRVVWNIDEDLDDDGATNVMDLGGGVFVNANNTYQLTFKIALAYDDTISIQSTAQDFLRKPKVEVALSGSAIDSPQYFNPKSGKTEVIIDEISADTVSSEAVVQAPSVQPQNALGQQFFMPAFTPSARADSGGGGRSISPATPVASTQSAVTFYPSPASTVEPDVYAYEFTPTQDGYIQLVFKHFGGTVYLQDVSVKSLDLVGFTPNHTYVQFEVPSFQSDDVLDFKFDFINNQGSVITSFTTRSMAFTGSNQFVDNGQIDGDLIVGDGIVIQGVQAR